MYLGKLDDTVDKYNDTYHSTIKVRLVDVKSNNDVVKNEVVKKDICNAKINNMEDKYLVLRVTS